MSKKTSKPQELREARDWIEKDGYKTLLLADGKDLNSPNAQAQIVRFGKGKYRHYHKEKTELFYFTSGIGRVIIDGVEQKLTPGACILVRPRIVHEFINDSNQSLEAVMFKTNSKPGDTRVE